MIEKLRISFINTGQVDGGKGLPGRLIGAAGAKRARIIRADAARGSVQMSPHALGVDPIHANHVAVDRKDGDLEAVTRLELRVGRNVD